MLLKVLAVLALTAAVFARPDEDIEKLLQDIFGNTEQPSSIAPSTEESMIRPKRDTPECKLDNQPGVCVPYFKCDMILDGPVDDSVLEACPGAMDLCCPFEKLIAKEDMITPIVIE